MGKLISDWALFTTLRIMLEWAENMRETSNGKMSYSFWETV